MYAGPVDSGVLGDETASDNRVHHASSLDAYEAPHLHDSFQSVHCRGSSSWSQYTT